MASKESGDPPQGEREKLNDDISKIYQTLTIDEDRPDSLSEDEDEELEEGEVILDIHEEEDQHDEQEGGEDEGEQEDELEQEDEEEQDEEGQDEVEQDEEGQDEVAGDNDGESAGLLTAMNTSATPETCLMLNRAYQEALTETITNIETILQHSRERQKELEKELESGLTQNGKPQTRDTTLGTYGIPYIKDVRGRQPPQNEDVISKRLEYDPYAKVIRTWHDADQETLTKAVIADSLKKLMQPLMNKKTLELEKLELATTEAEKKTIQSRLDDLQVEITQARHTKKSDLCGKLGDYDAIEKMDWLKISAFDFDGDFSESYLQAKWLNQVHPHINKNKWTPEEDEQLACLAEAHRFRNWHSISAGLGTNRSAFQCLQRFQTKLNPSLAMGPWTPEEDTALRGVIETFTFDSYIAWHQVACYMEGRTREQCIDRWQELNKDHKRGRWSMEEDVRLLAAVHCYGQNWSKVQQFVSGRTNIQIRERWFNALKQDLKHGSWSYSEDRKLILAVQKHGEKWATVAREMEGRTDNMVLTRYRRLMTWKRDREALDALPPGAVEEYQQAQKTVAPPVARKSNAVTSIQVAKLLEEKKAEEDEQERERLDQLVLKIERCDDPARAGPSHEGGQEEVVSETQEDLTEIQEENTGETQAATKKLRRATREKNKVRDEAQMKEKMLIDEDLAQGIYVPRPLEITASRVINHIEKRKCLHSAIMTYVRDTLKSTAKGDPQVIYDSLKTNIRSNHLPFDIDEVELTRIFSGTPPTVRNLLKELDGFKRVKQRQDVQKKTDIYSHINARSIELEIMRQLRDKSSMKRAVGRPKKHLAQENETIVITERSEVVEKKIASLMFTTMNIDRLGSAVMAKAISKYQDKSTEPSTSTDAEDEPSTETPRDEEAGDEQGETETEGPEVKEEELDNIKKRMRKRDYKKKHVYVHGLDEYNNKLVLRSPADERAQSDVQYLKSVVDDLESPNICPRVYRRRFVGRAERMYHIPPIPPNTSTLRGFRTLMLNRRILVKNAQNYYKPGSLDGQPSTVEQQTDDQKLQKAVQELDAKMNRRIREALDNELHLSDLTPAIIKKLKTKFTMSEINAARDVLRRKAHLRNTMKSEEDESSEKREEDEEDEEDSRTVNRRNIVRKAKLTHDYHLLKSRFLSLFLWPAMMSSFELPTSTDKSHPSQSSKREVSEDASDRKRKKKLPLTATKRARKQQVKSKSSKEEFSKTMSQIKKNSPPRRQYKKSQEKEGKTAAPRRQSRRLRRREEEAEREKEGGENEGLDEGQQHELVSEDLQPQSKRAKLNNT